MWAGESSLITSSHFYHLSTLHDAHVAASNSDKFPSLHGNLIFNFRHLNNQEIFDLVSMLGLLDSFSCSNTLYSILGLSDSFTLCLFLIANPHNIYSHYFCLVWILL